MANTLVTPTKVAREALFHLRNNLVFANRVHRDYKREFVKIGDTVTIRKPVKFVVSDGVTRVNQDVTEESTSIVINKRKHVSWKFTTKEMTLNIEDFSQRYIRPAAIVLANQVDKDCAALYKDVFINAGTAGTTPSAFTDLGAVAQKLDEFAVPTDERIMVLNPAANWSLSDGLKGLFWEKKVQDVVEKGFLSNVAGFDIFADQNIQQHTVGSPAFGAGALVDEAGGVTEGDAVIDIDTVTSGAVLEQGDILTFAAVNAVNPVSKDDLGFLMPFTVTAQTTAAGTQFTDIPVSPSFEAAGPNQNIDALPLDGAAVTLTANHKANLAFHPNAFALVTVELDMPDGVSWKAMESFDGINIRVLKSYDIATDEDIIRMDIQYGVKTIYPDLAARMLG